LPAQNVAFDGLKQAVSPRQTLRDTNHLATRQLHERTATGMEHEKDRHFINPKYLPPLLRRAATPDACPRHAAYIICKDKKQWPPFADSSDFIPTFVASISNNL